MLVVAALGVGASVLIVFLITRSVQSSLKRQDEREAQADLAAQLLWEQRLERSNRSEGNVISMYEHRRKRHG